MDVRATRRGVPAGVLWGALGVIAWAAFTVVTGGGSAHADESDDGLLDPLTSLVGDTVSTVTQPLAPVVTQVVAPVVQTVVAPVQQIVPAAAAPVVEAVTQAPVVGPVAAPVVETAAQTVEAVTGPVTDALVNAPVSQITTPVVDAVAGVPVVGDLLGDLGVIDLVGTVVGVVDDTVAVVGTVTDETVTPIVEALEPGTPGVVTPLPAIAPVSSSAAVIASSARAGLPPVRDDSDAAKHPNARVDLLLPEDDSALSDADPGGSGAADDPSDGPPAVPLAPTSSASSGGGSATAYSRLGEVVAPALPSWGRLVGATDDDLPSSAVADTDVSPD